MVTASHNPPEYNGYKVYWGNGAQIVPPHDVGIAEAIDAVGAAHDVPLMAEADARAQGLWLDVLGDGRARRYLDAILALRPTRHGRATCRIVYTAMHGVGGDWVRSALARPASPRCTRSPSSRSPTAPSPPCASPTRRRRARWISPPRSPSR